MAERQAKAGKSMSKLIVQTCGAIAAALGFVAIAGWVLGLPVLAGQAKDWNPMAPSAAVLFVLFGAALFSSGPTSASRPVRRTAIVMIGSVGTLTALLLLFLSLQGIRADAEHFGIVITESIPGAHPGHISPVTALGFVLTGLSLLPAFGSSSHPTWRKLARFCLAGFLVCASCVFLLGYLFGVPLLYGGQFIPPALMTSLAFALLGAGLLALSTSNFDEGAIRDDVRETSISWYFILVFVLFATAIVGAGYAFSRYNENVQQDEVKRSLSAVAELKVNGLERWRIERLRDATFLSRNAAFAEIVRHSFANPQDRQAQERVHRWLQELRDTYSYSVIHLFDAQGVGRMSVPARPIPANETSDAHEVPRASRATFVDFHQDVPGGAIHLAILVPLTGDTKSSRPVGAIYLGIDPSDYVYPFIQSWPIPSDSGETLLVRRDGDEVVYVNELRFHKSAALTLRHPLTKLELPAVKAALGQEGITEGVDYRGVPVIANIRSVPDSPWLVVAKVDKAEALALMQEKIWLATGFVTALLLAMIAVAILLWRHRAVRYYRERSVAAAALAASAERFRHAVEEAPYPIMIHADDGAVLAISRTWTDLTGYTLQDIPTIPTWTEKAYGERKEIVRAYIESIYGFTQRKDEGEYTIRCADGSKRIWDFSSVGLGVMNEGRRAAISIAMDVTERKQAEMSLNNAHKRLDTILDTVGEPIFVKDNEHRIMLANRAFCDMFGMDIDAVIGKTLAEDVPEDEKQHFLEVDRRVLDTGIPDLREETLTLRGFTRTIVTRKTRFIEDSGKRFLVGSIHDITERKRLAEVHLQAQKLESLGTLTGGIAHDFNNILAAIRGNADLAAEDVGPDHIAAESLEEIKRASTRAHELVRRIMSFGRPKVGLREVVDLGAVLDEVLRLLRSTLPAGIALNKDYAQDTPHVLADAAQVHEVIVNLTTNAAHAIGSRVGSIQYRLGSVQAGEEIAQSIPGLMHGLYARLTVTDSGCGMDAATIERIFDAFYTTKPVGKGTGLGLSMVHGIMRGHGGAVTVESAPGKGSSFALYFPAAEAQAAKAAEHPPTQSLLTSRRRVLYVDDEEALISIAKRVISRLNHSISAFTDPKEALAAFRAHPQNFDVVVTDLSMPQMSGLDLAREVLALRPEIPVLMTTGNISETDQASARAMGIRELLLKPVTMDELGRVLDRLFRDAELNGKPSE